MDQLHSKLFSDISMRTQISTSLMGRFGFSLDNLAKATEFLREVVQEGSIHIYQRNKLQEVFQKNIRSAEADKLFHELVFSDGKSLRTSPMVPVLQFPGRPILLDFSFGAGQILALQLLNSWNRHVEMSIREITTKQNLTQVKTKADANGTLEELRDLIFYTGIDEKISVNYRRELQDLANPSKKTSLYEFPMPPRRKYTVFNKSGTIWIGENRSDSI